MVIGSVLPFGSASMRSSVCGFALSLRQSRLVGVGHKPQSISPMGRIDGTSW
jgi:hypothetical protein